MTQRYQMDQLIVIPRTIAIATPAAGAEFNYTSAIPTFDEIISVTCTFTASAVAANRRVTIEITDGTAVIGKGVSTTIIAANAVATIVFSPMCTSTGDNATPFHIIGAMTGKLHIPFNGQINSITELIDGADQFSAISLHVHRRYAAF